MIDLKILRRGDFNTNGRYRLMGLNRPWSGAVGDSLDILGLIETNGGIGKHILF